jgi:uncharacterized membrane protein YbhN (UPF0104 family)
VAAPPPADMFANFCAETTFALSFALCVRIFNASIDMNPKSLIKALITVGMLAVVAFSISFDKLLGTLKSISPVTAMIVIVGYTVGQLMSSVKWWTIARSGGINVSYGAALKAYFIGMFVNCFGSGLGTVGGDVARGILLANGLPKKTEGVAAVIADRIHGLTVLSLIALVTSQIFYSDRVPSWLIGSLVILIVGFIAGWVIGPWLLTLLPEKTKFAVKMRQVAAIFPRDAKTLAIITGISVVFHCVQILLHSVMASAVGAEIPLSTLFVVIPLVNIASSLPISWNGLGVRETSYIFFLTSPPPLVSPEQAAAFGAMWLLAVTITSAVGGIVALVTGDLKLLKSGKQSTPEVVQTN